MMDEIQSTPEDKNYKVPAVTLIEAITGEIKLRAVGEYKLEPNPDGTFRAYANANFADNTAFASWVEISSADEPQKDE